MGSLLYRPTKATAPILAVSAAIALPNSATAHYEIHNDKPSPARIAYCMKRVLREPRSTSLDLSAHFNPQTGVFDKYFKASVSVGQVPDKEGDHCDDVATRQVEPKLVINGTHTLGRISLIGNPFEGKASIETEITDQYCMDGSSSATAMAKITASPTYAKAPPQVEVYRTSTITTSCAPSTH